MFHFTPYMIPFILSALILCVPIILIWRLPHTRPVLFMLATFVCMEIWAVGFIFEISVDNLEGKLVLANLQFIGIDTLPITELGLILTYSGHLRTWNRFAMTLLCFPILSQLVIWTDPLHHLFRHEPSLDLTTASFPILVNDYSYWYYFVQMPYANLLFVSSIIVLIYTLRFTSGTQRKQILLLLFSIILPMTFNVLYIINLSPIPHFNLSVIGFIVTGLLLSWSLLHYDFLDLMPVARSVLVDTLTDGWIVLDHAQRFIDLNQTAQSIIGQPKEKLIGHHVKDVLSHKPELAAHLQSEADRVEEVHLGSNSELYYDVSLSPLQDGLGKVSGKLIVLRDITPRVQAKQERERLILELQAALAQVKMLNGLLPICANCKNIRDDQGYWQQVEMYLEQHAHVKFSHGICPTCIRQLYPDIADEVLKEIGTS